MKKGSGGRFEAVGHDEQMEASRCFAASKGQLGCISCHDPHRLPAAGTKVAYYRERCLACHEKKGCALPLTQRQSRGQGDDCIACHMPRPAITNVPHTAATDHRIPRGCARHGAPRIPGCIGPAGGISADGLPLAAHDRGREAARRRRDMGVAQGWAARNLRASSPEVARVAAMQGLPLLEAAVRDRPDDLSAREFLGHALEILGRPEDGLQAFEEVLRIEPGRELALRSSGRLLTRLQRPDRARIALQKTIAVNPWMSDYHLALAGVCYQAERLARGRRGLPRCDPAQPRIVRGPVAPGPVLPAGSHA